MRGTNTGLLPDAPQPTHGTVDLPGVDVITVGPDGITSVVGYVDQKTMVEQLGMQALVMPRDEGPMHSASRCAPTSAAPPYPGR